MMGDKKLSKVRGEEWIASFDEAPDLFDDVPFKVIPKFKNKTDLSSKLSGLPPEDYSKFKAVFQSVKKLLREMG